MQKSDKIIFGLDKTFKISDNFILFRDKQFSKIISEKWTKLSYFQTKLSNSVKVYPF